MQQNRTEAPSSLVIDGTLDVPALAGRLSGRTGSSLAVLDLDSTLFNTAPRNRAIMAAAAAVLPEIEEIVPVLTNDDLGWGVTRCVSRRAGLDDAAAIRLEQFWRERFFSSATLVHDVPYPGAADFVRSLEVLGITIVYLSGRDAPNMEVGTVDSLRDHGFPVDGDTHLILKPDVADDDLAFKKEAIRAIRRLGTVVLVVENEPANANALSRAFPDATVLLIDTITAPDPAPLDPQITVFQRFPHE